MRRTVLLPGFAIVALAALLAPARLAAQAPGQPSIVGIVQDSAGRPLPSVQITIARLNRGTTTAADGRFEFRQLPPGEYHVDALMMGYAPTHTDVAVFDSGSPVSVRFTLRVAAIEIPGLDVTSSPTSADPLAVPHATTQLTGKALERSLGNTLASTLESQPGLATRYAGPAASAPVIRGLSGERVLVLVNGERAGDLSSAASDHAVSVDPLSADRIEVIRGPASLLYGNAALGGVVNVISNAIATTVPTHATGTLAAQGESATPGGAFSGLLTVPIGSSLALTARGGGRRTEDQRIGGGGILDNTSSRNYSGGASLGYEGGAFGGGAGYEGYAFRYGLPSPAGDAEAGVHIEGHRHQADFRGEWLFAQRGVTSVHADGTAQWYSHDEIERTGAIGTSFSLQTQTTQVVAKTALGRLSGAIGVSGLFRQYAATGEEALTPAANSTGTGVFVYQALALTPGAGNAARLEFGGRYDGYRIRSKAGDPKFGPATSHDYDAFSTSIGLTVPLRTNASLGASVARAFRAPTVEELFSNAFHAALGSYDVGNPGLKAETNTGVDGVFRVQARRVSAQFSGYYNRIANYIGPNIVGDTVNGEGDVVPLNVFAQADATIRGLEGQIEGEVGDGFVLGAMGDWLRGRFVAGGDLPFMPAARVGASARWDNGRFSLGSEWRHSFRQDHVAENETGTGAYDLVNMSAGAQIIAGGRVHSVTVRIDNLMDQRYREATSRIKDFAFNPGRNLSLVYKVLF